MREGLLPALVMLVSSLPAFLLARSFSRERRRLATLLRLAGVAMLAGAVGLAWAAGDPDRTLAVALAMAIAVNGLGVVVLLDVLGRRRGRR